MNKFLLMIFGLVMFVFFQKSAMLEFDYNLKSDAGDAAYNIVYEQGWISATIILDKMHRFGKKVKSGTVLIDNRSEGDFNISTVEVSYPTESNSSNVTCKMIEFKWDARKGLPAIDKIKPELLYQYACL